MRFGFLMLITFSCILGHSQNDTKVRMTDLEGTWYVNMSNFPMWIDGKKQNPRFNYTLQNDGRMLDEVTYEKNGKTKQIVGYDAKTEKYKEGFIWRGKGLLIFIKSKWRIIHFNAQYKIVVLAFEKTLFSPAGFDVISRNKTLDPKVVQLIEKLLPKLGVNAKLSVIEQL